jgi:hypothetical protein
MSTREFVIKQVELMPEEALEAMKQFISFQRFNLGIYNKEIRKPLSIDDLTEEELNAEIQKGVDSMNAGRVKTAKEVEEKMQRLYKAYGV